MNLQITEQELEQANEQGFFKRPISVQSFKDLAFKPEMISKLILLEDIENLSEDKIKKSFEEGSLFRTMLAYKEFKTVSNGNQSTIYTTVYCTVSEDSKQFKVYLK